MTNIQLGKIHNNSCCLLLPFAKWSNILILKLVAPANCQRKVLEHAPRQWIFQPISGFSAVAPNPNTSFVFSKQCQTVKSTASARRWGVYDHNNNTKKAYYVNQYVYQMMKFTKRFNITFPNHHLKSISQIDNGHENYFYCVFLTLYSYLGTVSLWRREDAHMWEQKQEEKWKGKLKMTFCKLVTCYEENCWKLS